MNTRIRSLLTIVVVVGSAVLALAGVTRLVVPGWRGPLDAAAPGLIAPLLPPPVTAALALATALAGLLIGVVWRAEPRDHRSAAVQRAAVVVAVAVLLLAPGGLIPVAGYTFALVVIVGVVVMVVLLVRRHPGRGLLAIVALGAIATWAIIRLDAAVVAEAFGPALLAKMPEMLLAVVHLAVAVGLIVRGAAGGEAGRTTVARWVLRHRTAITATAACCALPYSIARASWLTPWPLLAPEGADVAAEPGVIFTGLCLGAAMLTGGVLTLGLIRPWGRRFPQWMAGLGGRDVPVALAVVPASVVAALFTAGGLEMLVSVGAGDAAETLKLALMFPFWLWGPLLALAVWGYAMDRRGRTVGSRPERAVA